MSKKLWLITAAIIAVIILLSMSIVPFNVGIVKEVYPKVVGEVVDITGLSRSLIRRIVIILLLPLFWIVPVLLNKEHNHKKIAWAGVSSYVVLFFLAVIYFSRTIYLEHDSQQSFKWYAITPEGVKYYDKSGVDPVYGIELQPLTPEIVKNLKLLETRDAMPIDPEKVRLINPVTGEAQAWYSRTSSHGYEFYDKPGYHPKSGIPLVPVTEDVYQDWLKSKSKVAAVKHADSSAGRYKRDNQGKRWLPGKSEDVQGNREM